MKNSKKIVTAKLGIGPLSTPIIEAAVQFSEINKIQLMLIASKNQIDFGGGYVNGWTTGQFAQEVKKIKLRYPKADILLCRDHCGPGFTATPADDLDDVYKTIEADLEAGFDFIHVDFCHFKGDKAKQMEQAAKALDYTRKNAPATILEIGTDENKGSQLNDIERIKSEMDFFTTRGQIDFFVCETGTLIKEINQRGVFNEKFIEQLRPIANEYGLKLKEHNADYLGRDELIKRRGLIDAVNVAPQFGVIQTQLTLLKCLTYGIDVDDFMETAYRSKKWQKWLDTNTADNKLLCSVIAGHYVFADDSYKIIYDKLHQYENFSDTVRRAMMDVFKVYTDSLIK